MQTNPDEEALRKLPQLHCDAWNNRDAHALAAMFADDGDFVTVATVYLHGRADYETFHARLLDGRFQKLSMAMPSAPLVAVVVSTGGRVGPHWWPWKVPAPGDASEVPPFCRVRCLGRGGAAVRRGRPSREPAARPVR